MDRRALVAFAALMLAPAVAYSEPASPAPSDQGGAAPGSEGTGAPKVPPKVAERTDFQLTLTTLDALRKKGSITEEEYNAALRDLIVVGQKAATAPTFVVGRFITTVYGYLEGDVIHDTNRAVGVDSSGGNPTLGLPGPQVSSTGTPLPRFDMGRTVFTGRGTRLGLRFAAPEFHRVRVSGNWEMDFLGNQPGSPSARPPTQTESTFLTQPEVRLRHGLLKVDTDYVTFWIGQTWNLMAFEAAFLPTSVQFQGLPGQLFGRNPQVRLSHVFDAGAFSVELAAAVLRPPQFNSEMPDFQGGLKLDLKGWTGVQSIGSTGTTVSPLSVAVTGAVRRFRLATSTTSDATASATGSAVAVDTFIPLIPAKERGGFSVAFLGEFVTGSGLSDLYTGLNGGVATGAPTGIPAATYTPFQDLDVGPAAFNRAGVLDTINWRTFVLNAQIHYGPLILAGNYSNVLSDNIDQFTTPAGTTAWYHQTFWDANLMVDVTPGVRLGLEFSRALQRRLGEAMGNNSRIFFAGFFLF